MIESNNPVDMGEKEISPYKEPVETILTSFSYRNQTFSLPELIRNIDPREKYVMSTIERNTYLALREGMQIFKAMSSLVADKSGLKQKIEDSPTDKLGTDQKLRELRDFTYTYACYAASLYVSKILEKQLHEEGVADTQETRDLSVITLDTTLPEETVLKRLILPVYAACITQKEGNSFFKHPLEFPLYVKGIFDRYGELAKQRKGIHPQLERNVEGYQFRIMDDTVILCGFEDRSTSHIKAVEQKVTFQPVKPHEIVGNRNAKRKIIRYIERMCLYAADTQKNPIIELGGLSWSVLFDGLPGTGKSSLYRMAMTLLDELAQQVEIACHIVSIDQSIKDEFYGKTGKILIERLGITQDPAALTLCIFDDIDLLTSHRDEAQGADNDVNNIIMQYMDGMYTVRRGNVINFAASNKPTGVDDALRNRFNDRLLIDGPTTPEDFADMVHIMGGGLISKGLLKIQNGDGYTPFATQDMRDDKGNWNSEDVSCYMAEEFAQYKTSSLIDFGRFMAELKQKNPHITGRSSKAIIEAVKERCADFDIPREWFENRSKYLDLPYTKKCSLLEDLYTRITPDILFQEARRYFDSEERFTRTEAEGHVTKGYNNILWDIQGQIKFYEDQVVKGDTSEVNRLQGLKLLLAQKEQEGKDTMARALANAL
ncbi:MAG: AAA family ATPase [bacterium]